MPLFRINYFQVISQANTIKDLSDDLKTQISRLQALENEIKANWQGRASETLLNQIQILITDMNSTYNKIFNVSTTIKNVANRIHREDEEAAARARALAQQNK